VQEQVTKAQAQDVSANVLVPLSADLTALSQKASVMHYPSDSVVLLKFVEKDQASLVSLVKAQSQEMQALEGDGQLITKQYGSDAVAIQKVFNPSVQQARNDKTIGTFLKIAPLSQPYSSLEHYSTLLASTDPTRAGLGAAGVKLYSSKIHDIVYGGMPSKTIIVSIAAQQLWAYENGKEVMTTLVTTGRPQLPTDIGPMKVILKSSPWVMHSPWGPGSPWWYPDTMVRKVLWFTASGEGLHDARWQPDSTYGPGSENVSYLASHGCIHLPGKTVDFLYDWAPVGTPVIVYPGDGTPADSQISRDTIDNPSQVASLKGA
jgi:lipoprotein-anchoring transpeptidase ErfK/SrfK